MCICKLQRLSHGKHFTYLKVFKIIQNCGSINTELNCFYFALTQIAAKKASLSKRSCWRDSKELCKEQDKLSSCLFNLNMTSLSLKQAFAWSEILLLKRNCRCMRDLQYIDHHLYLRPFTFS